MPLTVFHPSNEDDLDANADLRLDIVAVHGLNGDSHDTWTCKKSKKLWLRDFLPEDLPTGRIMTFGYNATAAFQNSVADIEDHARDLLGCLNEKRQNGIANRPLVFVAHSLGGHVVKQALVLASRESRYSQIFNHTNAVIFFGTPHKGSDLATYGRTFARVPSAIALVPHPELLQSLIKGSPKLRKLNEQFIDLLQIRMFNIVSFYETKPLLYFRKLVVTKESALLTVVGEAPTYEHPIPVPADHRKMCQFSSLDDKTYKSVVTNVRLILRGETEEFGNEHFVVSQLENPNFTGRNEIRHRLYDTLLKDRHMRKQSQDIFVLYGLGGSGKTQVCLKFAHERRNHYQSIFWINASTEATAEQSFLKVARECNQEESIESVKRWLCSKKNWLLIIDNADDPSLDVAQFFPACDQGSIIITSRNQDSRQYASQPSNTYRIDQMSAKDGVSLLLKTAMKECNDEVSRKLGGEVVEKLGYLALAIVQAGAVIRQNLCSLETFCDVYAQQKKQLLESGRPPADYNNSVYTTWEISVKQIQVMSATDPNAEYALELLQTFSYLHFDGISEQIFERAKRNTWDYTEGSMFSATSTNRLMPSGWDQLTLAKGLRILLDFSLITVDCSRQIAMHPVVHEWSRERLSPEERVYAWETAISTMAMSIYIDFTSEDYKYRRMLKPHIAACLASPEGKEILFADGLRIEERYFIVDKLVMAYEDEGQGEVALDLHTKNLRLKRLVLQSGHHVVVDTMRRITYSLRYLERFEEAIQCHEELLENWQAYYNITQDKLPLDLRRDLAYTCCLGGYHIRGFEIFEEVIREFTKTLGPNAATTLLSKSMQAHCLALWGRYKEAAQIQESTLVGFETTFSKMHPATLINLDNLANSYWGLGKKKKARRLRKQTLVAIILTFGEFHPRTLQCQTAVMNEYPLLANWKNVEARKEVLQKAQMNLGELHIVTLKSMSTLAEGYVEKRLPMKAKEVQERTIECMMKAYGEEHPNTIEAKRDLVRIERILLVRKICYWWLPKQILDNR